MLAKHRYMLFAVLVLKTIAIGIVGGMLLGVW